MGNMRFKVGDRVRIKSIDWYNENKDENGNMDCGDALMITEKSQFCGKIVTISNVRDVIDAYKIEEDNECYNWTDEMIEGLVEEETKFGTASKPIEIKSNANCLTRERVDALATKIDKELPSGNQNVWELPNGYQFTDENGNVINATKIVLEKKKKEYPKSYKECAKIMNCPIDGPSGWLFNFDANIKDSYYRKIDILMGKFTRLLICRDAYWKIAGEEMGLGKPWEPDWIDGEWKWCVCYSNNNIEFDSYKSIHHTFSFPTAEMRDAFYDNFKEEIEIYKELL